MAVLLSDIDTMLGNPPHHPLKPTGTKSKADTLSSIDVSDNAAFIQPVEILSQDPRNIKMVGIRIVGKGS
jgi:hypothetical protein